MSRKKLGIEESSVVLSYEKKPLHSNPKTGAYRSSPRADLPRVSKSFLGIIVTEPTGPYNRALKKVVVRYVEMEQDQQRSLQVDMYNIANAEASLSIPSAEFPSARVYGHPFESQGWWYMGLMPAY